MRNPFVRSLSPLLAVAAAATGSAGIANAQAPTPTTGAQVVGHVYEATNSPAGNAIQIFDRLRDGQLRPGSAVATGGLGLGASLASQNALVREGGLLFVVNAGDDTISTLAITRRGLVKRDVEPTGGDRPVSVTVHGSTVYVLNQGSGTISGLRLGPDGHLSALPRSTRQLSKTAGGADAAAAQVSFTPNGRHLLVTHKGDQTIDTFAVHGRYTGPAVPNRSAGSTPYGFGFDRRGHAIVSEAGPSAVSSYAVRFGGLRTISPSVSDTQAAACWLVTTRDGRYAFTVNAASSTISSYRIGTDGRLSLLAAVAARTTGGGTDAALSPDNTTLQVRLGNGDIASDAVSHNGSLTPLQDTSGTATSGTAGLATD
ncbi:lactonase family protein [Kribbella sp. NBC_00889]|uniref:lactonase family protein n=1 Tax=Kribbella sp. NBC_00889 TaxID=2975974 RepID=UPI00386B79A3|nr:lactonase family protein [Kribbella sp. NBC_00889]